MGPLSNINTSNFLNCQEFLAKMDSKKSFATNETNPPKAPPEDTEKRICETTDYKDSQRCRCEEQSDEAIWDYTEMNLFQIATITLWSRNDKTY